MVTIWPRWQSLLVYLSIFLSQLSNFISSQCLLLNQLQESQSQTHRVAWTERDIHAALTHQPTLKVLEVVKITYTLCAGSWNSLACGFLWEPCTGEQRGTRTGQSFSQKKHFVGCFLLAATGTDHFPRKLLRFHVLNFFFHFHCVVRVKVVAFGSYIPSALLLFPGSRDFFPSGETQRRCPLLEEHGVKETRGEILPNAMHNITLKISWMR